MRQPTPKTAYARRGYGHDRDGNRHETTFVSADRADDQPIGWERGWFEDGHLFQGYALIHVMEPSWRVREPVALVAAKAA